MIAACPKCSARYRIDKAGLRPEGVRLRCSKCEAVFRVRAPEVNAAPDRVAAPAAAEMQPPIPDVNAVQVLIADPLVDEGKAIANALAEWGIRPILVHDGVEAVLTIQRNMPAAVIIDAALPKMYGFQVCELLKRNESLRHIHVVLVGAIHNRHRYRRDPTELYGADAYLERPQLPEALWPVLRGFGLTLASSTQDIDSAYSPPPPPPPPPAAPAEPAADAPVARPSIGTDRFAPEPLAPEPEMEAPIPSGPEAAVPPAPAVKIVNPPAPDISEPTLDPEIAKAERLARIVVSDIILYNQEKFDAAVRAGNVVGAMGADLEEGRALFTQRIDASVRENRDFLMDELIRVAGMRRPR